jgi:hypothetical protein
LHFVSKIVFKILTRFLIDSRICIRNAGMNPYYLSMHGREYHVLLHKTGHRSEIYESTKNSVSYLMLHGPVQFEKTDKININVFR